MNIEYKITNFFEKNNLFDTDKARGLTISRDFQILLIKGSSRDLVELADLLTSLALAKTRDAHIHIDDLTLLNKKSDFSEIIIEKE